MGLLLCMFLFTLLVSIVMTSVIKKIALRKKIVAIQNNRTIHKRNIPLLGGVSIFIAFIIGVVTLFFFTFENSLILKRELIVFLFGGFIILIIGIYDDIKGVTFKQKFAGQILAASIVVLFGYKINTIINPFGGMISLGVLSIPVTFLWIIFITNALNLIDGLDGLAAGISFGALIIMVLISLNSNNLLSALPTTILAGAIGGFLIFNFNPAKIFLGDSGSLFIGFMLACFSINGTFRHDSGLALYLPLVVLGVPVLDTLIAFLRRISAGRNPFIADKKHIHHKLLELGFTHRTTVLLLYGFSFFWGIIAFCMSIVDSKYILLLFSVVCITALLGLRKLGYIKYFK